MLDQTVQTSYDLVPYPSTPMPASHPDRLATIARLFGLNAPPITNCRVLDVGCGDGANLIPLAYRLSESEFIGIDLSARQIAAAQAVVAELGLKNIKFQVLDLLEAGPELGQFDYIISYGVYSWTPPEVRDKLLALCGQLLTPQGVAYISYNALPGWRMYQPIREMLLYHIREVVEPAQRVAQARAFLDFLAGSAPVLINRLATNQAYSLILEDERKFLSQQSDAYLLHDLLEEINEPVYFHQFADHAARHGLRYLGEADFSTMMASYFLPGQIAEPLREMVKTGLAMEQYLDFLRNRTFRQTLLCRQEVTLDRDLKPERLLGLHVASPSRPEADSVEVHSTTPVKFIGPNGVSLGVEQPLSKAALLLLAQSWPQSISFDTLVRAALAMLNPAAPPVYSAATLKNAAEQIGANLLTCYALNLVKLYTHPPQFVLEPGQYPQASALARLQIRQGRAVTSLSHEVIVLSDDLSYYLLPYLDGQHNRAALLKVLEDLTAQGMVVVDSSNGGSRREFLEQALEQCLRQLGQAALLIA